MKKTNIIIIILITIACAVAIPYFTTKIYNRLTETDPLFSCRNDSDCTVTNPRDANGCEKSSSDCISVNKEKLEELQSAIKNKHIKCPDEVLHCELYASPNTDKFQCPACVSSRCSLIETNSSCGAGEI